MKILVIGGAGYIGSHIVLELLTQGYSVTVFDNLSSGKYENLFSKAHFIFGDLKDKTLLNQVLANKYDTVIYLAALKAAGESMIIPDIYAHHNIVYTINLLDALLNNGNPPIIFSSSAAVYGDPQYLPLDEQHPTSPANFYGFTKLEIEKILQWYDQLKQLKFVSLRYFNAAGYDKDKRITGLETNPLNLIPIVMETAVGIRPYIEVFGDNYPTQDGTCLRDYIHVTDLAKAHVKACEYLRKSQKSRIINLGTGKPISVFEIIQTTTKITQKKLDYKIVPRRAGDPTQLYTSVNYAKEILDWQVAYSDISQIIQSTWDIYQINYEKNNLKS